MINKCSVCGERIPNCICLNDKQMNDLDKAIEDIKDIKGIINESAIDVFELDFKNILKQLQQKKKQNKYIQELKEEAENKLRKFTKEKVEFTYLENGVLAKSTAIELENKVQLDILNKLLEKEGK